MTAAAETSSISTMERAATVSAAPTHPVGDTPAQQRDLRSLAERIHGDHPASSLDAVIELVDQAYTQFGQARVQSFRMILTERAVRRSLRASQHTRAH